MLKINGYTSELLLTVSEIGQVYSAVQDEDQQKVTLYVCPAGDAIREARLQQLYGLISKLKVEGVLQALRLLRSERSLVMVLQWFDGETLKSLIKNHRMNNPEILKVARSLAITLSQIHSNRIIHSALQPKNILVELNTLDIKITGFEQALAANRERKLDQQELVADELPYFSPEQTGRMGRDMDFRSDLYTLGVTLYEMAVGRPPFLAEPMELIHLHLAGTVIPPHNLNNKLSEQLSRIILKLLEKDPDLRYQTARGLFADLTQCSQQSKGAPLFDLGTREMPDTLILPSKLYGRQQELKVLQRVFRSVLAGSMEIVTLIGQPGVGKTALVMAFRKSVQGQRVFFSKGRFDRHQSTAPYAAIIEAFSTWVGQILTGSDEDLAVWKARLREGMGQIGQVMIDVVPNLKWIIGSQAAVPMLGPAESQDRLKRSLLRFVDTLATPDHPLVLFLDDLQWADQASLEFLESLFLLNRHASLMLIASFRQQDVSLDHSFTQMLSRLESNQIETHTLHMQLWSHEEANSFISDTLARPPADTLDLAELVKHKTANNPLYVRQFLLHAYNLGLIYFSQGSEEGDGWFWKADAIERAGIPDDIVGMMTEKVASLPDQAREVLELAGCIGGSFEPETLVAVSSLNENDVALSLYFLTVEGLLAPAGACYHFTHDRIHEAVVLLLPDSKRSQIHLKMGRYLQSLATPETLPGLVFGITNQLNNCIDIIEEKEERIELAELNLLAVKSSLENAAHGSVEPYLKAGISLIAEADWQTHYRLTFELHLGAAESLFLRGKHNDAQKHFKELLARELSILDRARVVALMVTLYNMSGDAHKSVEIGLEGLANLGVKISSTPTTARFLLLIAKCSLAFTHRTDEQLLNRPSCEDPLILARNRILVELIVPSYFFNTRLSAYLGIYNMWSLLRHGHHDGSPLVMAMFGLLLGNRGWGTLKDRYRMGCLASKLETQLTNSRYHSRIDFLVSCHINPWIKPLRACIDSMHGTIQSTFELGDLQYAVLSNAEQLNMRMASGEHLHTVQRAAEKSTAFIRSTGFVELADVVMRIGWLAAYLRGDSHNLPYVGTNDPFQLERLKASNIPVSFLLIAPYVVGVLYHMAHFEEAFDLANRIQQKVQLCTPFSRQAMENTFFLAMSCASLLSGAPRERRSKMKRILRNCANLFQKWEKYGPANHHAQAQLIRAEICRSNKKVKRCWYLYTSAIDHARNQGFEHLLAIIHERMGNFALEQGWEYEADNQLSAALNSYHVWGANAKLRQFQETYSHYLQRVSVPSEASPSGDEGRRTLSKGSLDLSTVVESSLAISQEVKLEKVLERVMTSAIENAGAQRGLLLLKSENGLWLEAEGSVNGGFLRIPRMDPVDSSAQLPMTIVRYVQRTSEMVVLGEAKERGLFKDDPYIAEARARSVLMMPILTQNKFVGVLYLENSLVGDTFTRERTEVLRVIAAQAAIALQNARLYDELSLLNRELERRVEDRTTELRDINNKLTVEVEERIKAEKDLMDLQSKLVETARRAGMTEVAIGVLHNVGNVLNSVTISATCLLESFKNSKLPQLDRLVELLNEHKDDLADFLTTDERGRLFPAFLAKLAELLGRQRQSDKEEVKKLTQHLSHTIEVIRAQQDQANVKAVLEPVVPFELLEQALKINATDIKAASVEVVRTFDDVPCLLVDKHKILQILINLIKNAVQSMASSANQNRLLTLKLDHQYAKTTLFSISDTGLGISEKHLSRVFSYGFTTKSDGHGFGLHNAANAATELGGSLRVESDGTNQGACFILALPLQEHQEVKAIDIQR